MAGAIRIVARDFLTRVKSPRSRTDASDIGKEQIFKLLNGVPGIDLHVVKQQIALPFSTDFVLGPRAKKGPREGARVDHS